MRLVLVFLLGCSCWTGSASPAEAPDAVRIQQILERQVVAWNDGNLAKFVAPYAEHCTLVGKSIDEKSREEVLAHYREKYPSAGSRGKLTFSDLHVRLLDARAATVTGHWRLERDTRFGGPVGGVFSLVFARLNETWEIILDHTS